MAGKHRENPKHPDPNLLPGDFSLTQSSSLSQPSDLSEPPDIRNWFSSYVYESPALDGAVKDLGSGKSETQEGNVGSEEETEKETKILDTYYSHSVLSEPPDIRNWFSSYVYESPALDTEDGFKSFENGERESQKGIVDSEEHNQSKTKGNHCGPSKFFRKVSGKPRASHGLAPLKDDVNPSLKAGNSTQNLESKLLFAKDLTQDENYREDHLGRNERIQQFDFPLTDKGTSSLNDRNSTRKLETELSLAEDLIKRKVEKNHMAKELDNVLSGANSRRVDETSSKKLHEEDEGKEVSADGFISTKKNIKKSGNCRNSLKRTSQENQSGYINKNCMVLPPGGLHGRQERKPLLEKTNFQVEAPEIAGKWQCPQESKPDLGPPMKQLRLERWISRVQ